LLLLQCCENAFPTSFAFKDVVIGCAVLNAEVARFPSVFAVHACPLALMALATRVP
jgi:hypothetical protein